MAEVMEFKIVGPGDDSGRILMGCPVKGCWWSPRDVDDWTLDEIIAAAAAHLQTSHSGGTSGGPQ